MRSPEEAKSGPVSVIASFRARSVSPESITTGQQIAQRVTRGCASRLAASRTAPEGSRHQRTTYVTAMRAEDVLALTASGVCCKLGDFYIDPTRPVERALITHGHSDHARAGHGAVLATPETLDLMRLRYGPNFAGSTQAIRYGEEIRLGETEVSFHPAGHVLGSAQIRVAAQGARIVASGDYKDVADPTCAPFELVPCDVFITEATFGLPVFRHRDPMVEI